MAYEEMTAYYRDRARYYRQLTVTTVQPRCAELSRDLAKSYERVAALTQTLDGGARLADDYATG